MSWVCWLGRSGRIENGISARRHNECQRYIVNHSDLLEAVCELAVLLGCDLSDV